MDILFKKGLPGLQEYKKFSLEDIEDCEQFKLLQSKDEADLGIILISPFDVDKDYEVNLSDEIIESLEIESPKDVFLYTTVTLNSNVEKITTNLMAPLIINSKNGLAEQVILQNNHYAIKHPIHM